MRRELLPRRLTAVFLPMLLPLTAMVMAATPAQARPEVTAPPASDGGDQTQANGWSYPVGVSRHGRFALFYSRATNLVPGVNGGHLYLRDLRHDATRVVDATAPIANRGPYCARLSARGRHAVYTGHYVDSAGDSHVGVILRDLRRQRNEVISVAADGGNANASSCPLGVSADGRYVVFQSYASNLVEPATPPRQLHVFVRDRVRQTTRNVAYIPQLRSQPWTGFVSPDGQYLNYTKMNLDDGVLRYVAVRHDLRRDIVEPVGLAFDSGPAGRSTYARGISRGGHVVVIDSPAANLVPGDTNDIADVFVRDMRRGTTTRVSVADDGTQANGRSHVYGVDGGVDAAGRRVAFASSASNLVPGDTNGVGDIFVRDIAAATTVRVSVASDGGQANASSDTFFAQISADGRHVVFRSFASNLVPGDTNGIADVFLRDLRTGVTTRVNVG